MASLVPTAVSIDYTGKTRESHAGNSRKRPFLFQTRPREKIKVETPGRLKSWQTPGFIECIEQRRRRPVAGIVRVNVTPRSNRGTEVDEIYRLRRRGKSLPKSNRERHARPLPVRCAAQIAVDNLTPARWRIHNHAPVSANSNANSSPTVTHEPVSTASCRRRVVAGKSHAPPLALPAHTRWLHLPHLRGLSQFRDASQRAVGHSDSAGLVRLRRASARIASRLAARVQFGRACLAFQQCQSGRSAAAGALFAIAWRLQPRPATTVTTPRFTRMALFSLNGGSNPRICATWRP